MFIKTQLGDVSFPSPGDLPNSETEPRSPTLQVDSLPVDPQGKPKNTGVGYLIPSPADLPDPGIEPWSLYCRWILEGIVGELFTVRDAEAPGGSDAKESASIILTLTLTLGHLSRSSGGGLLFNLCV